MGSSSVTAIENNVSINELFVALISSSRSLEKISML